MKQLLFCIFLLLLEGCSSNQPPAVSGQIDELPAIYPDYIDVTIPQSIAPLNFAVQTEGKACAVFTTEGSGVQNLPTLYPDSVNTCDNMAPTEPFPFPIQTGKSY